MTTNELWDLIRALERKVNFLEIRLEALEDTVADHGSQIDDCATCATQEDLEYGQL